MSRTGRYLIATAPDGTEHRVSIADCLWCKDNAGSFYRKGHPPAICAAHGQWADRIRAGEPAPPPAF